MPPELLELSTVALCHNFHSIDWYNYMASKLPLTEDGFARVQKLHPGEALVFAARTAFGETQRADDDTCNTPSCHLIRIRPRITEDRGGSRLN